MFTISNITLFMTISITFISMFITTIGSGFRLSLLGSDLRLSQLEGSFFGSGGGFRGLGLDFRVFVLSRGIQVCGFCLWVVSLGVPR